MDLGKDASILITGATGNTGSAVITALAAQGVRFRAMVRNQKDLGRLAVRPGELAIADFDDDAGLTDALIGMEQAYLVTPSSEKAQVQQTRFLEIAADCGIEHIVLLSQLGATADSPVRFLRYHAAVEQRILDLGLLYTFLRPNLYYQGLFAVAPAIKAQGRLAAPIGDAAVSAVDVRDIGAVAAAALIDPIHRNQVYDLTGPAALTHAELAAELSAATGRDVTFEDVPPDVFAKQLDGVLPPWQVEGLLEDYARYRRGEAAAVSSAIPGVLGRPATSFAEFARDHASRF